MSNLAVVWQKGSSRKGALKSRDSRDVDQEEVLGRISLRTSSQKLRSGPPNPGKTSMLARTSRTNVHEKNFGLKNFAG